MFVFFAALIIAVVLTSSLHASGWIIMLQLLSSVPLIWYGGRIRLFYYIRSCFFFRSEKVWRSCYVLFMHIKYFTYFTEHIRDHPRIVKVFRT